LSNPVRRLKERPRVSSAIAVYLSCTNSFIRIFGAHGDRDPAARRKLRGHDCLTRRAGLHEIVENAVRNRFIEGALAPIRGKIKFERLAFNAQTIRHIIDVDSGEVCLPGHRTKRGKIIGLKMDAVVSPCRIRKSLEARFRRRGRQLRFAAAEQCQLTALFNLGHVET